MTEPGYRQVQLFKIKIRLLSSFQLHLATPHSAVMWSWHRKEQGVTSLSLSVTTFCMQASSLQNCSVKAVRTYKCSYPKIRMFFQSLCLVFFSFFLKAEPNRKIRQSEEWD